MRLYKIIFVSFVLAAAGLGSPVAFAESGDDRITFIVPVGTPVTDVVDGSDDEVGIFTGQPVGVTGAGSCQGGDGFPLQDAVFVHPHRNGGAVTATVIVTNTTEPIPAGTRVDNIAFVENCTGPDGAAYDKYEGTLR